MNPRHKKGAVPLSVNHELYTRQLTFAFYLNLRCSFAHYYIDLLFEHDRMKGYSFNSLHPCDQYQIRK